MATMSTAQRIRILVVDDDSDIRAIIAHTLKTHYEVLTYPTGVLALERIDICEPDLIIMDVLMPVLSGVDTVRAIKKDARFAQTPVIFLTACSDNALMREAMRAGGDMYILKPFDPADLLATVQQVIQTHRLVAQPKRYPLDKLVAPANGRVNSDVPHTPISGTVLGGQSNDAQSNGSAERARVVTPPVARRVRILVVDDEIDVVNYVKSILRDDYEVIGVSDSELAPERIITYQPDIILLDIVMPKLNGFHLSHLIRMNRRLRESKIIFVSSRSDQEALAKAYSLGAADYLEKPFTPEQLRRRILAVTQQPDFICPKKRLNYMEILRREGEL